MGNNPSKELAEASAAQDFEKVKGLLSSTDEKVKKEPNVTTAQSSDGVPALAYVLGQPELVKGFLAHSSFPASLSDFPKAESEKSKSSETKDLNGMGVLQIAFTKVSSVEDFEMMKPSIELLLARGEQQHEQIFTSQVASTAGSKFRGFTTFGLILKSFCSAWKKVVKADSDTDALVPFVTFLEQMLQPLPNGQDAGLNTIIDEEKKTTLFSWFLANSPPSSSTGGAAFVPALQKFMTNLLARGADVFAQDKYMDCCFHHVTNADQLAPMLDAISDQKMEDLQEKYNKFMDRWQTTPVMKACRWNSDERLATMLIDAGFDCLIESNERTMLAAMMPGKGGTTPLDCALHANYSLKFIFRIMFEKGAKPNEDPLKIAKRIRATDDDGDKKEALVKFYADRRKLLDFTTAEEASAFLAEIKSEETA